MVVSGLNLLISQSNNMTDPEFSENGTMKWQRVIPKLYWEKANAYIVADRFMNDGTRQHMIQGSVTKGTVIANAEVIGEADGEYEFADKLSHLSKE